MQISYVFNMIEGLSPIILNVRKFEESLKFFRDLLGFEVLLNEYPKEEFTAFSLGSTAFSIRGGYEGPHQGPLELYFLTSDIHGEVARLKSKGVNITKGPEEMPWGGYIACFVDMDENQMYLYQSDSK